MIFDTLSRWEYNRGQYGDAVRRALAFIAGLNTADMPDMPDMLEIEGKRMFVMKQRPATGTFEERLAEVHERYADIHLVVEGEEWQGFAFTSDTHQPVENRLEESDYALFRDVRNEARIRLLPGDFSLYGPGEIHRTNCHPAGSIHLVKLVVKIHRDLL